MSHAVPRTLMPIFDPTVRISGIVALWHSMAQARVLPHKLALPNRSLIDLGICDLGVVNSRAWGVGGTLGVWFVPAAARNNHEPA